MTRAGSYAPRAAEAVVALALAAGAVAQAGCDDAPARPAPRPSAAAQESRALVGKAMTDAVAIAVQARRAAPVPEPVEDDPAPAAIGRLDALLVDPDDDDDPGGVVGGVLGAPDPSRVPGIVGGSIDDITVQLLSDSDGVDADLLRRYTTSVRLRADVCRREAAAAGDLDDAITARVTLSVSPRGGRSVHATSAGPLGDCLERLYVFGDLPDGATLTFEVGVPPP